MPLSINLGPVRYHQPAHHGEPALWTVVKILAGLAAAAVLLVVCVVFAAVVVGAWMTGLVVGAFRSNLGSSQRYATAVMDWARDLFRE